MTVGQPTRNSLQAVIRWLRLQAYTLFFNVARFVVIDLAPRPRRRRPPTPLYTTQPLPGAAPVPCGKQDNGSPEGQPER